MKKLLRSVTTLLTLSLASEALLAGESDPELIDQLIPAPQSDPETVLVTYHIQAGKAPQLLKLINEAWETYWRLGLVFDKPHLVMRGDEQGGEFFAEILPWKSHDAPDNAPAEVHAIWDKMQLICEKRGGRDRIEIPEVEVVRGP